MKYRANITVTMEATIEVEADSEAEAKEQINLALFDLETDEGMITESNMQSSEIEEISNLHWDKWESMEEGDKIRFLKEQGVDGRTAFVWVSDEENSWEDIEEYLGELEL